MTAPDSSSSSDDQTLYRLLGVTPSVSDERLRHVYEWAVADASRRGDQQAVLMLSRAFDTVKAERQVYRAAGRPVGAAPLPGPSREGRAPRRIRGPGRPAGRRPGLKRMVGYGLGIAAVLAVFAFLVVNSGQGRMPSSPSDQQFVIHQQVQTSQTQQPQQPPPTSMSPLPRASHEPLILHPAAVIVVPRTAPTAADGLARILCQQDGATSGYVQAASRGSKTSCTNGATPRIIG